MTRKFLHCLVIPALALVLAACGSGSGSNAPSCIGTCAAPPASPPPAGLGALSVADVQRVASQAVAEAQARQARATIAVVDRVGNVLLVFRMNGAQNTFRIASGRAAVGGLENIDSLPDSLAAIAKALTGAYLSSDGNAFSTRTASQIIQQNFNPGELLQPSGPLYGVQFSQFSCSDVMRRDADGSIGPKRSPLGLAADPGGIPLYRDGHLAGAIGVIADGQYSLDLDIGDVDSDLDEVIAVAGSSGYAAPADIRADRITVDGRSLRFTDSTTLVSNPEAAPSYASLAGAAIAVPGYAAAGARAGTQFGTPASGLRPDTGSFADLRGQVLVDAGNNNRYAARNGSDGLLGQAAVGQILRAALVVASRARAQIRRPLGSAAQVSIAVVDSQGEILGLLRSPDAPVFGIDVAVQKARTAAFFSSTAAAGQLQTLAPANYVNPPATSSIDAYVTRLRAFIADNTALANGIAYSTRAIGNLSRPLYPDGISPAPAGPLSTPLANWSPFHDGLQLDLSYNAVIAATAGDASIGCTGLNRLMNGMQVFAGAVPIYRNGQLLGAIGVSGDGVDQDDMVAFLGLANAATVINDGTGNANAAIRADTVVAAGTRLRYVQCPQSPFNDSTEQNACVGR